ncbi:MAG: Nif3-like dinuclear metal center hexameric protein [Gammaproteobacteria bacterium]
MINLDELVTYINDMLEVDRFADYCPNGLQVEGRVEVKKLVSGVTACQALLDAASERQADAILVHHGYFWRGEDPRVIGMKRLRLATLLETGMSLLAYHLPLDAHPIYGNNAQLGERLDFVTEGQFGGDPAIGLYGHLAEPMAAAQLTSHIERVLQRPALHIDGGTSLIHSVAWCTGAAQGYIEQALALGVDAFISGEISERTTHVAREAGTNYIPG